MAFERVIVEYPDGSTYGPATLEEVAGWIRTGRTPRDMILIDEATAERKPASEFDDLPEGPPPTFGEKLFPKNNHALASYYLGFGALLAMLVLCVPGIFVGGAAVAIGVMAIRNARRDPTLRGEAHAWTGIILGFIATVLSLLGTGWFVVAILPAMM